MRETDIAIVGAGLAGSLAATMLGRAGHSVTLIDPFASCPADFRCEKLEEAHVETLRKAGVLDAVLPASLRCDEIWVARLGRLAEIKQITEYGIDYSTLVNRLRSLVPADVAFVQSKATDVAVSPERQTLSLANGEQVSARLVIGANGVMAGTIGARREISRCHSVSIGFDVDSSRWPFDALTYFGEDPVHRVAYLTLFPLPSGGRANLFVYRELNDPWLKRLRGNPAATIAESLPQLAQFTGPLRAAGPLKIRPVDLAMTDNVLHPGVALVGDAFSTACPVSGTGAAKALLDVERLCNVYVPAWLATPGMSVGKIAQYYNDAEKKRSDAHSFQTSVFAKRAALGQGLLWTAFRWGYFAGSQARNFLEHGELAEMAGRAAPARIPAAGFAKA
ncbi:MAG: FAD-dependent monooxygenase [Alphaproteobacteria bacterium]|nr:MAG: FAD-dependent monooxygenase [Alphaproteobacteria bacterium]